MGEVSDGVLRKFVDSRHHFLRHPPAISLDASIFARFDLDMIAIVDTFERKFYWSTADNFRDKSIQIDRGFGRQLALGLEHWKPSERESLEYSKQIQ